MNEKIKTALEMMLTAEFDSLPTDHIAENDQLLRFLLEHQKKQYRKKKHILAFVIAAMIALSTTVIAAPIIGYIIDRHEKYSKVSYIAHNTDQTTAIQVAAEYLPDGFQPQTDQIISTQDLVIIPFTDGIDKIDLQVYTVSSGYMSFNTENTEIVPVFIQGVDGMMIQNAGQTMLHWRKDHYIITLTGNIDTDSLLKVAQSIKIKGE